MHDLQYCFALAGKFHTNSVFKTLVVMGTWQMQSLTEEGFFHTSEQWCLTFTDHDQELCQEIHMQNLTSQHSNSVTETAYSLDKEIEGKESYGYNVTEL